MILKFEGKVQLGDPCRVSEEEDNGAVKIGYRDLVAEVMHYKWNGPVTVAIADERFCGDLDAEFGWGYSEYTPMDPDILTVGPHNILNIISNHDGEHLTVWIADEPVNVLDATND